MTTTNPVTVYALDTVERAAKTGAQFTLAALGATAVNVFAFNWVVLGGAFGAGFVLSLLTSLASLPVGGNSTASLVPEIGTVVPPAKGMPLALPAGVSDAGPKLPPVITEPSEAAPATVTTDAYGNAIVS